MNTVEEWMAPFDCAPVEVRTKRPTLNRGCCAQGDDFFNIFSNVTLDINRSAAKLTRLSMTVLDCDIPKSPVIHEMDRCAALVFPLRSQTRRGV